jgi:PHS family inorganic phosphate transporter-like MFS transporter
MNISQTGRSAVAPGSEAEAALARLDDAGVTKFHRRVLLTSGMGFFTDAYDLFIIGVALSLIKPQWHPSALAVSLVGSTALIASALGAVVFGRLADRLGRRRIYGLEVIILAAGAIATALSPNIWWLIGLRFVVGFGVGGDYPVSATIMSEYAGRRSRGRMVALVFSMQAVGLIVGPLVVVALLVSGVGHEVAWRVMLGLGAVPALAVFYLRRKIHETPRFALAVGDEAHAIEAVRRVDAASAGDGQPQALRPARAASGGVSALWRDARLRRWLIGAAGAWFLLDFAFYGNTISSPQILKLISPHAGLVTTSLETLAIFVLAAAPGYLLAAWRIDTRGRRPIQTMGFAMMAVSFLAIGVIPGLTSMVVPFLALYGISYFFTQYGPNTTTFVYPAELFPVSARTTGHGIAAAAGKLGAFVGTFLFPLLLTAIGLAHTELIVAGVCLAGVAVTLAALPEPKQRSLEEISGGRPSPTAESPTPLAHAA